MQVNRVEDSLTAAELAEIRAALRAKGDGKSPSYGEIAEPYGLHREQVRRIHKRMKGEPTKGKSSQLPSPDELNLRDALVEMRERVKSGHPPTGLFAHITRDELMAMMAGMIRILYLQQKSPATLLKAIREYGLIEGMYEQKTDTDPQRKTEFSLADLTRIEQETQEHLDAVRSLKQARQQQKFLRKYGEDTMEVEAEEVGSVGEEQGG